MTQAGGDYFYTYGPGLFIVLNTNNYNVAEHELAIQQAVNMYPDVQWRVVTIHQDIYGSGLDHSDTDGMILRTQLTPVFDRYDLMWCFRDMTTPTAVPSFSTEMGRPMAAMSSASTRRATTTIGTMHIIPLRERRSACIRRIRTRPAGSSEPVHSGQQLLYD